MDACATRNLDDFPPDVLARHELDAIRPDDCLTNQGRKKTPTAPVTAMDSSRGGQRRGSMFGCTISGFELGFQQFAGFLLAATTTSGAPGARLEILKARCTVADGALDIFLGDRLAHAHVHYGSSPVRILQYKYE
jgi:hypothetical protein